MNRLYYKITARKNVISFFITIIILNILVTYLTNRSDQDKVIVNLIKDGKQYSPPINKQRLNRLFQILQTNENKFSSIFNHLKVFLFKDLIYTNLVFLNENKNEYQIYLPFQTEIRKYLTIVNKQVEVNDLFLNYLNNLSDFYSFQNEKRDSIVYRNFNKVFFFKCYNIRFK